MSVWMRWLRQPQGLWLRKAIFQVHLWVGIALSLYILVICLSGSVLVYRNELYARFAPTGDSIPAGFRATTWLLNLHDNLLAGRTGRRVNGLAAMLVLLLAATGAVVWWPGMASWRRSLTVAFKRRQRFTWRLHSALGFWFFGFVVMWGISGVYLAIPQPFSDAVEMLEPYDGVYRASERLLYWIGYSHFGRFERRLPGCGPACGATLKAVWALFAIVPVVLLVTGVLVWWNRVIRTRS